MTVNMFYIMQILLHIIEPMAYLKENIVIKSILRFYMFNLLKTFLNFILLKRINYKDKLFKKISNQ